jgi:hypothetical protein
MSSKPVLVERRAGERRKEDRRKTADIEIGTFISRCMAEGVAVEIQDQRQLVKGKIVAENDTAILVLTVNQKVLLLRHGIVSIARAA